MALTLTQHSRRSLAKAPRETAAAQRPHPKVSRRTTSRSKGRTLPLHSSCPPHHCHALEKKPSSQFIASRLLHSTFCSASAKQTQKPRHSPPPPLPHQAKATPAAAPKAANAGGSSFYAGIAASAGDDDSEPNSFDQVFDENEGDDSDVRDPTTASATLHCLPLASYTLTGAPPRPVGRRRLGRGADAAAAKISAGHGLLHAHQAPGARHAARLAAGGGRRRRQLGRRERRRRGRQLAAIATRAAPHHEHACQPTTAVAHAHTADRRGRRHPGFHPGRQHGCKDEETCGRRDGPAGGGRKSRRHAGDGQPGAGAKQTADGPRRKDRGSVLQAQAGFSFRRRTSARAQRRCRP